jgi:hypothetical protein
LALTSLTGCHSYQSYLIRHKRPAWADPARAPIHIKLDKIGNIEGGTLFCPKCNFSPKWIYEHAYKNFESPIRLFGLGSALIL